MRFIYGLKLKIKKRIKGMVVGVRYCMSTIFVKRSVLVLSLLWVFIVVTASMGLGCEEKASKNKAEVFYLVYPTESIEAATETISIRGGAGYAYKEGWVAFGVYFKEEKAGDVLTSLQKEYPTAQVHRRVFSWGNYECWGEAYTVFALIDGWIGVLESGGRQSIVKEGLQKQVELHQYMGQVYDEELMCELALGLEETMQGIVYANEIRLFLCDSCDKVLARMKSVESLAKI